MVEVKLFRTTPTPRGILWVPVDPSVIRSLKGPKRTYVLSMFDWLNMLVINLIIYIIYIYIIGKLCFKYVLHLFVFKMVLVFFHMFFRIFFIFFFQTKFLEPLQTHGLRTTFQLQDLPKDVDLLG